MRRISGSVLIAAVYLSTSTLAQSSYNIFERKSTACGGGADYFQCSISGQPDDFCCPTGQTCVALAANTTVLCCPSGSNCSSIQPITCDLSVQNATLSPTSPLHTTALNSALSTCGNGCCPFGYTCNSSGGCTMNANQDVAPVESTSSSSSTPGSSTTSATGTQPASVIPVTTSSASSSANSSPNSNSTTPIVSSESCDKFPVSAVLVGFFPGLFAGALLTLASICLCFNNRREKSIRRNSGSSFGNISDPQPSGASGGEMRVDFLRKQPNTPSTGTSVTPARRNTITRMRSMFRKSTSTNGTGGSHESSAIPPLPLNVQKPMMQMAQDRPVTPHLQREPSYEDINIFADQDTASTLRERERMDLGGRTMGRTSHQTTFTDMIERSGLAGLQKGQPYVYKGNSSVTRGESPRR